MELLDELRKLATYGISIMINPHLSFLNLSMREWIEEFNPEHNLTDVEFRSIERNGNLIYIRSIFSIHDSIVTCHFDLNTAIELNLIRIRSELANQRLN